MKEIIGEKEQVLLDHIKREKKIAKQMIQLAAQKLEFQQFKDKYAQILNKTKTFISKYPKTREQFISQQLK